MIQISMQLTSHTGLVQVLSYPMFAGTHFTYPQRDEAESNPQSGWVGSRYWTQDLSHDSPLLYQLSYPGRFVKYIDVLIGFIVYSQQLFQCTFDTLYVNHHYFALLLKLYSGNLRIPTYISTLGTSWLLYQAITLRMLCVFVCLQFIIPLQVAKGT